MSLSPRTQLRANLATGQRTLFIGNAAGSTKTLGGSHGVQALCRVPDLTTITIGTYRAITHPGNPGQTFFQATDGNAVNFLGIPTTQNFPDFCTRDLPVMIEAAHAHGKELSVSINEAHITTLMQMMQLLEQAGVDRIEINLACPNLESGEMLCYLPDTLNHLFGVIVAVYGGIEKLRIGLKCGIYSNPAELLRFAELVKDYEDILSFIVSTNTFPNCLIFDAAGRPGIESARGLGGGSGPMLAAIARGQVYQLREVLGPDFTIIGCGGITTGRDVEDMLLAGATELQVGTAFYAGDVSIFPAQLQALADAQHDV